jgi:hypothetical protein
MGSVSFFPNFNTFQPTVPGSVDVEEVFRNGCLLAGGFFRGGGGGGFFRGGGGGGFFRGGGGGFFRGGGGFRGGGIGGAFFGRGSHGFSDLQKLSPSFFPTIPQVLEAGVNKVTRILVYFL